MDDNKVVGLDFAMYRVGSIDADSSYFVFQLQTLAYKPLYRRSVIDKLQTAFLRGYDPSLAYGDFFAARPMLRLHLLLHQAMRLAGILALNNPLWYQKLHNRRISSRVIADLLHLADGH